MNKIVRITLIILSIILVVSAIAYADEASDKILTSPNTSVSQKENISISLNLGNVPDGAYKVVLETNIAMSSYFDCQCTFNGLRATFILEEGVSRITGYYTVGASTLESMATINLKVYDSSDELLSEEALNIPITQSQSGSGFPGGTIVSIGGGSYNTIADTNTKYLGSSDNYLKSLSVDGYEFNTNFNTTNDTYFITVGEDVTKISVKVKTNSSSATYTVYGTTNLKEGMNKVLITVTAENGSARTYRIYVTKEASSNEEEN